MTKFLSIKIRGAEKNGEADLRPFWGKPTSRMMVGGLFHGDQEIILLALLHEQVFAVDEVFGCDGLVERADLFLVQADAAALYELAHVTLTGEDLHAVLVEEVDGRTTEQRPVELVMGHVLEDILYSGIVELCQLILRCFAEEDVAGCDGHVEVGLRVDHAGDFLSQSLLQDAAAGILRVLFGERLDGRLVQISEDLDIAFGIFIADIEPELIEGVGRGAVAIEPDVAALGLAELLPVGLGDQRAGQTECFRFLSEGAADELRARCHVAPLVVSAQLELHAVVPVEVQEVVTLQQLVGELSEAEAVACLSAEPFLHTVLGHHIVDGDVLAHFAGEIEEGKVLHPVVVVDHLGSVGLRSFEIQELGHLLFDGLLIMIERVGVKQIALLTLAGGVADHACGSADEQERLVAAALEVAQHHDAAEVTDVQRVGRRIGSEVGRDHFALQ